MLAPRSYFFSPCEPWCYTISQESSYNVSLIVDMNVATSIAYRRLDRYRVTLHYRLYKLYNYLLRLLLSTVKTN